MSSNVNLIVTTTCENFLFSPSSPEELVRYIINDLQISQFNLISQAGQKYTGYNYKQIWKYLSSKEDKKTIIIVPPGFTNRINISKNSRELHYKISNQMMVKTILNTYLNERINQVKGKMSNTEKKKYVYKKHIEYLNREFVSTFENFKVIIGLKESTDFDTIMNSSKEFQKIYSIFEKEFELLKDKGNALLANYKNVISQKILGNKEDLNNLSEKELSEVFQKNLRVIQSLIECDSSEIKNEFLSKKSDIQLYLENLEYHYKNTIIPLQFLDEIEVIKKELINRKNFDFYFEEMTKIINKLISIEEKRRNDFIERIKNKTSTQLYNKFIQIYYQKGINDIVPETKISEEIEQLKNLVNSINFTLFNTQENKKEIQPEKKNSFIKISIVNEENISFAKIKEEINNVLQNNLKIKYDSSNETIGSLLRLLNEKTKIQDQLLDLSNSSLACSIAFDDKPFQQISIQRGSSNNLNSAIFKEEMVKLMKDHGGKIYFYGCFCDFIKDYLEKYKKIDVSKLDFENPETLGDIIEKIIKENIKLVNKFKKLRINN